MGNSFHEKALTYEGAINELTLAIFNGQYYFLVLALAGYAFLITLSKYLYHFSEPNSTLSGNWSAKTNSSPSAKTALIPEENQINQPNT
jgi:hypothetical protein